MIFPCIVLSPCEKFELHPHGEFEPLGTLCLCCLRASLEEMVWIHKYAVVLTVGLAVGIEFRERELVFEFA